MELVKDSRHIAWPIRHTVHRRYVRFRQVIRSRIVELDIASTIYARTHRQPAVCPR